jgi:uncharacterized Ntn-hydrolase superfamily protein
MTYSIIARCERTGRLGIGITTFSLACGGRLEGMRANVGICKTQAWGNRGNDPLGVKLLAEGFGPKRVMEILEANDPEHAYRQIAIIDRDGNIAAHTGEKTRGWTGSRTGRWRARGRHEPPDGALGRDQDCRPRGFS